VTGPLAGKVVAITGASRGIGLAIAAGAAQAGARVALLARDTARLSAAAKEIGDAARAIPADISDPSAVRAAFAAIDQEFGRLDVLVNNAAVAWPHTVADATDEQLHAEVGTNLLAPLYTIRAAIPLLRRSGGGDIINVSTESVTNPFPHLLVYAATKAALETLSAGLIHELSADGIRVTILRAGRTEGGELRLRWDEQARLRAEADWDALGYRARVSGSAGQPPERVADAVVFVASRPQGTMIDVINVRAHS